MTERDDIEQLAAAIFGSASAARRWLDRSHPLLGGRAPRDVSADGLAGRDRVLELLAAVRYGGAA